MSLLILASFMVCAGCAVFSFGTTATLFLGVFSAIPVVASIDVGSGVPLISATRALAIPLLAGLALQIALRGVNVFRLPLAGPLTLFVVAHVVALIVSENASWTGWLHTISLAIEDCGAYVLAFAVLTSEKRTRLFLTVLGSVLIVILAYNCGTIVLGRNPVAEMALSLREGLQFDYSLFERFGLPRFQAFFRNPLDLGMYLTLAIPAAVALIQISRTRAEHVFAYMALSAGLASAIMSGSRTVIYTLALASAAFVLLQGRWRAMVIATAVVGLCSVVIQSVFKVPVLEFLVSSALFPSLYRGDVGGSSWHSLLRVTGEHLHMALERPLFGWGVATLPPNPAGAGLDPFMVGYGEQGISQILVETGFLGFGAFCWLAGMILKLLWHGRTFGTTRFGRSLCGAYLCGLLGYLVGMQLEGVWHFGMMLACVAAATNAGAMQDAQTSESS